MAKVGRGNVVKLTAKQQQRLIDLYSSSKSKKEVQELLSIEFEVTTRTVRTLAKELGLNPTYTNTKNDRVMVYDIETSRIQVKTWWTGKQYINHSQLKSEPTIISIAWKWIGEDKVYYLTWDENH